MSKHTTRDVLRMAGHLLADPKRHTTKVHARDSIGLQVMASSKAACSWCVMGGLGASLCALGMANQEELDAEQQRRIRIRWTYLTKRAAELCGYSDPQRLVDDWNLGPPRIRLAIAAKLRSA